MEDAMEFDQRPKTEDYDDFVSIVAFGARGLDEPLLEVHCFSRPSASWCTCARWSSRSGTWWPR
jgi:hypothetical protein